MGLETVNINKKKLNYLSAQQQLDDRSKTMEIERLQKIRREIKMKMTEMKNDDGFRGGGGQEKKEVRGKEREG